MRMYEVGGCVRDEILGVKTKDIDFSVVLDKADGHTSFVTNGPLMEHDPFGVMVHNLKLMGFRIFKEHPEHLTARAKFPKDHPTYSKLDADFVLARKEGTYTDGRRPDMVEPGTLEDDLARRDFTMNAVAKDSDGSYIDPFNGQADIAHRVIRTVGDPKERLMEDALRAVRALRFAVTKKFAIEGQLMKVLMWDAEVQDAIIDNIADERIGQELEKMFAFDTMATLNILHQYRPLTDAMFHGRLWLTPTLKARK